MPSERFHRLDKLNISATEMTGSGFENDTEKVTLNGQKIGNFWVVDLKYADSS